MKSASRLLGVALFGIAELAMTAPAKALTFQFSFSNDFNGGGQVTGRIYGLEDNATGNATRVIVNANEAGFGLGIYATAGHINPFGSFTVANGDLTQVNFQALGLNNAPPLETCCSLFMVSDSVGVHAGLTNSPNSIQYGLVSFTTTPVFGDTDPPPVPLPAPLALLASGLVALAAPAWLRRRRAA
jgi:hypothetical protein